MRSSQTAVQRRQFTVGTGIITISPKAFKEILGAPSGVPAKLEDTPVDAVQAALRLPPEYVVVGVGFDFMRNTYLIGVEHPELPTVPEGQWSPEVTPIYSRAADGTVSVLRIDVRVPQDNSPWHPTPLPE